MKNYLLILALFITALTTSQELELFFNNTDVFFAKNVNDGRLAYLEIHDNPSELNKLLELAENIEVDTSKADIYKAFWINAYNLLTIKGIINNYPLKSPLDVSGFFDKILYEIGGKSITLNGIENELLRGNFEDPRFHFVLVCGALGCPPIIDSAYKPDILDAQLDKQTKLAINGNFLKVNNKKKRIEASEIMKWYNEDFTLNDQSEIEFINTYRTEKIPNNYKLTYFSYNWNLNKQ